MATGSGDIGVLSVVDGVRLASVAAGVRYQNRRDVVVIEIAEGSTVAGTYTLNAFCAAPVKIARQHLSDGHGKCRYWLINTGNANAGTGKQGKIDALACCQALADLSGCQLSEVLPFSTGVIGERLPAERIAAALPAALEQLQADNWLAAAKGILTTDTRPKGVTRILTLGGKTVTITGISKGAGMIKPNMATMLSYVATDLQVDYETLQRLLNAAVTRSFNRITVDGDTSTNDCCMLAATGRSGLAFAELNAEEQAEFSSALNEVLQSLAIQIIEDAEGASKFVTIDVTGGGSEKECLQVAYAVAESPLVKTALTASDPNWGRILAAVGRAGINDLDVDKVSVSLDDVPLVEKGQLSADYSEEKGQAVMDQEAITITIDLGRGDVNERVWTSDLSEEYVRINASYRS